MLAQGYGPSGLTKLDLSLCNSIRLISILLQELSGTSVYEHVHSEDTQYLMECHRNALRYVDNKDDNIHKSEALKR